MHSVTGCSTCSRRVHLEEIVPEVAVDDEFDRAGAHVAHGLRGRHGVGAHAGTHRGIHDGRGRLLDDLLPATLRRAVALAEVDDVALPVGEDLDLDVSPVLDQSLEHQPVPSPNAASASRRAPASAAGNSSSARTSRMPRPPPPATALTSSGTPSFAPSASQPIFGLVRVVDNPVHREHPAAIIRRLAPALSPMAVIAAGGGPMNTTPASAQAWAKSARSDRKP